MKTSPILMAVSLLAVDAAAADWKPADGPLLTRWAKDVKADNAWPEYPRPQMRRDDWLNLNGVWQLRRPPRRTKPPPGKDLPAAHPRPVPRRVRPVGVMKPAERLWYRRTFAWDPAAGQRVLLHFGAVDWEATVWVNGKKLGATAAATTPSPSTSPML